MLGIYTREAMLVYSSLCTGCTMVGVLLPMYRVYHGGYTPSLPMYHPASLGIPHPAPCCPVYRSSCPSSVPLPDDDALGSEEEKPLGERSP